MIRGTLLLLLVTACVTTAAGCGDATAPQKRSGAATATASGASFVQDVEETCARVNRQLLRLTRHATDLTPTMRKGIAIEGDALAHLQALRPPAAMRDGYAAFTHAFAARHAARMQQLARLEADDFHHYRAVEARVNAQTSNVMRTAKRLALGRCPTF
ncbi:MAG: hypothetical protein JSS99_06565 [Actinobacteria bacterium]|nr:hypothetical protein [Actinomycetota bacterium]